MPPSSALVCMAVYLGALPDTEPSAALRAVVAGAPDHVLRRLAIYKNNVYHRLVEALRDTYPAVERLTGTEFFQFAALIYATAVKPERGTLLSYGNAFPEFLRTFPPAAGVPYLADVARLEYLHLKAYHGPDAEPLTVGLGCCRPEASVSLHPTAQLMESEFPASRIWELNRREGEVEASELPAEQEFLLVIRPHRKVEVRRVSEGVYAALLAFGRGASIECARTEAVSVEPRINFDRTINALSIAGTFASPSTEHSQINHIGANVG